MKQSGNNPGTPVQNETLVVIKIILSFNFYFFKNHENTINSVLTDFFPGLNDIKFAFESQTMSSFLQQ